MTLLTSSSGATDAEWPRKGVAAEADSGSEAAKEPNSPAAHVRAMSSLLVALSGLRRFGSALTGSAANGDDFAQAASERAPQRPGLMDSMHSLESWMRRIIPNGWLHNRKSARQRHEAATGGRYELIGGDGGDAILYRSQLRATRKAMDRLTPELREALILVTIDGLSYRDAAARLGVPVACLNSRVARARASIAEQIGLFQNAPARRQH